MEVEAWGRSKQNYAPSDITKGGASGVEWEISGEICIFDTAGSGLSVGDYVEITASSDANLPNADYAVIHADAGSFWVDVPGASDSTGTCTWTQYTFQDDETAGNPYTVAVGASEDIKQSNAASNKTLTFGAHGLFSTFIQSSDFTGAIALGIYNLEVAGGIEIYGPVTQGVSADKGLCGNNIIIGVGTSQYNALAGAKIKFSGAITFPSTVIWQPNDYKIDLICTGTTQEIYNQKPSDGNYFRSITIPEGCVLSSFGSRLTNSYAATGSTLNEILGTLEAVGSANTYLGCISTGTFRVGVNGNISGNQQIRLKIYNGATVDWLRTSAASLTGALQILGINSTTLLVPAADISNCSRLDLVADTATATFKLTAGTLKIKAWRIYSDGTGTVVINNSVNNPNIEMINGSFSLNQGSQANNFVMAWQKGTGTITFKSYTANKTQQMYGGNFGAFVLDHIGYYSAFTASGTNYDIKSLTTTKLTITNGQLYAVNDMRINIDTDLILSNASTINIPTSFFHEFFIGGNVSFSSGCDILGAGNIRFCLNRGFVFTNAKTTAFSLTGKNKAYVKENINRSMVSADFSNSGFEILTEAGTAANTAPLYFSAGTFRCKSFAFADTVAYYMPIDNSYSNPSFVFYGAVNTVPLLGTSEWIKGTGTITYSGTTLSNLNFGGAELENFTFTAGSKATWIGNMRLGAAVFNGELTLSGAGTTHVVKDPSGNGTITGTGPEAVIWYTGIATFAGTLVNARFVKIEDRGVRTYYGAYMNRALKVNF
jgi:hypothetical protein